MPLLPAQSHTRSPSAHGDIYEWSVYVLRVWGGQGRRKGSSMDLPPLRGWSWPGLVSELLLLPVQRPNMWRRPWPGKKWAGRQGTARKSGLVAQQSSSRCSYVRFIIIIILSLNKYASKSLAGSWNCNQYGCVQPMSVFSKSAHATAAKEAVFSWDSDLAASNKRSGEEKFLQDLFSPEKLSIVYHSMHGIWLPIHENKESSPLIQWSTLSGV